MRCLLEVFTPALLAVAVVVTSACEVLPENQAATAEIAKPRSCNREATTGSNIPRCDDGVAGVTRAEQPIDPSAPVVFPKGSSLKGQ